jgi:hypothetical protein
MLMRLILLTGLLLLLGGRLAHATSNHEYGADEYDTIVDGLSPDGKYAITTHGQGYLGYDNFRVYLTDAISGKKIGPLEEISEILDTGANAYCAQWSSDSTHVTIFYRISRHEPLKSMAYRIGKHRAFPLSLAPQDATDQWYWSSKCSFVPKAGKVFGTPKAEQP